MQPLHPALRRQGLHVAPQGHGGDAEFVREVGDPETAALPDECEHPLMTLVDVQSHGSPWGKAGRTIYGRARSVIP